MHGVALDAHEAESAGELLRHGRGPVLAARAADRDGRLPLALPAVSYTHLDVYKRQGEVGSLVDYLACQVVAGYTILTWNGLSFDFNVLAEESGMHDECAELALNHVDMMFHIFCLRGHYLGLDLSLIHI